jgi:UDPglucose 6-dehydrogenase
VLRTIHSESIQRCEDPIIAIWGLAYKQDTDSTKNSPSIALLENLKPFQIRVFDPVVPASVAPNPRCHAAESEYEACDGADVLAVMTPWAQFAKLDLAEVAKRMRNPVVLDPYRVFKPETCRDAGLSYHTLGVPSE